jgi:hypothetical protein
MGRVRLVLVGLLVAAVRAGSASATVIGQTPRANTTLGANTIWYQLSVSGGTSYTVPTGSWRATSWSIHTANATFGPTTPIMALLIGSRSCAACVLVQAVSSVESVPANALVPIRCRGRPTAATCSAAGPAPRKGLMTAFSPHRPTSLLI